MSISSHGILKRSAGKSSKISNYIIFYRALGIRDILVRIRIPGSVPLTIGSGSNSGSDYFLHWFKGCKKKYFFLIICPQPHHLQTEILNFLLKFSVEILFCRHYFSPLNTFMRKGKDPDPVSDPYLWLMDPDTDPGGPKTCGSGSGSGSPALLLKAEVS